MGRGRWAIWLLVCLNTSVLILTGSLVGGHGPSLLLLYEDFPLGLVPVLCSGRQLWALLHPGRQASSLVLHTVYTAEHLVFSLARQPKLEFQASDTRWQQHGLWRAEK